MNDPGANKEHLKSQWHSEKLPGNIKNDSIFVNPTLFPCFLGVDLESTQLSEAQTPGAADLFPLRQGRSGLNYLIDVELTSDALAGSIKPQPTTRFTTDDTGECCVRAVCANGFPIHIRSPRFSQGSLIFSCFQNRCARVH